MTLKLLLSGLNYELWLETRLSFLSLAKACPMHGLLTTLRACVLADEERLGDRFSERLVEVMAISSRKMLQKLSSEDNASFEDMGRAVDAIVGEEVASEAIQISDDHQLVLACAWLNLKEVSLLCGYIVKHGKLVELADGDLLGVSLTPKLVSECGLLLETCLTRCRHKGVIESTNLACLDFSSRLLASEQKPFREIPELILTRVLDEIENFQASVTRRAAGLPMLIQKIVAAEARGKAQAMLRMTVNRERGGKEEGFRTKRMEGGGRGGKPISGVTKGVYY